jgi:hypothetical protein
MKSRVEKNVKTAIRQALDEDGLKATLNLSYNELDYNLEEIVSSQMRYADDDAEHDRLHISSENMAKSMFTDIRRQLRIAYATIEAALSTKGL